ncbi:OmpH family outer membrane protein [Paragemmobacter ruber]|uniref:OmpH family outer membrane protein n=1 Tax=Paragemmobacter ruber TaxID=1985673 RepID=A0ABW9YAN5_9RHOB|nr:OmpH family outer membrane protein [Rhodobacter ruber]NBE08857.1 OmpH family outer membrane protein [Rhodobacter ruber]
MPRGRWTGRIAAGLVVVLLASAAPITAPVAAQEAALPRAPILMIDRNRLFAESAFGRAAEARFEAESKALIAENLRLEQALETEERELTDQRATLEPEAFQTLAQEFDAKTEAIRAAQDTKSRAITAQREADRQRFLQAAVPVLGELMGDAGAVAIFDKEMVILSLRGVDITDEAIQRIDAALGDGSSLPSVEGDPEPPEAPDDGAGVTPAPGMGGDVAP